MSCVVPETLRRQKTCYELKAAFSALTQVSKLFMWHLFMCSSKYFRFIKHEFTYVGLLMWGTEPWTKLCLLPENALAATRRLNNKYTKIRIFLFKGLENIFSWSVMKLFRQFVKWNLKPLNLILKDFGKS